MSSDVFPAVDLPRASPGQERNDRGMVSLQQQTMDVAGRCDIAIQEAPWGWE